MMYLPIDSPAHRPSRSPLAAGALLLALALAGCGELSPDQIYDHTHRAPSANVLVLRTEPERPYTIIAQLSVHEETKYSGGPINELMHKAQALGADAVVLTPPKAMSTNAITAPSWRSVPDPNEDHVPQYEPEQVSINAVNGWAIVFK